MLHQTSCKSHQCFVWFYTLTFKTVYSLWYDKKCSYFLTMWLALGSVNSSAQRDMLNSVDGIVDILSLSRISLRELVAIFFCICCIAPGFYGGCLCICHLSHGAKIRNAETCNLYSSFYFSLYSFASRCVGDHHSNSSACPPSLFHSRLKTFLFCKSTPP